jgi:hypothetical protein
MMHSITQKQGESIRRPPMTDQQYKAEIDRLTTELLKARAEVDKQKAIAAAEHDLLKTCADIASLMSRDATKYLKECKVLQAEVDRLKEAGGWISISERMPTRADADENERVMWWRKSSKTCLLWLFDSPQNGFTHWMPLPDPPKGDPDD